MKKLFILALTCGIVGVQTASADPLMKYDYFDAAYQWTKFDDSIVDDGHGLDTKLSYAVIDNLALEGGYNYVNISNDIDAHTFKYGIASWYSFCDNLDLVGRVGGIHSEVDAGGLDIDDDGVYAGAQLRGLITDGIEGNLDALYEHIGGSDTWTFGGTTLFALTDSIALKTAVTIDDDSDIALLGGFRLTM